MTAKSRRMQYWTGPGGKTPEHATLYSVVLCDLAKAEESRFKRNVMPKLQIAERIRLAFQCHSV